MVTSAAPDRLPPCPNCDGEQFARVSLFGTGRFQRQSQAAPSAEERDAWLEIARADLTESGQYLVFEDQGSTCVVPLEKEWTRVGRSLAADVRFDDPTVSRRHALIVRQPDGVRVLDDRSLNGVFVNGERVEWRALSDGDEILVGRYRLHYVVVEAATTATPPIAPGLGAS